VHLEGKLSYVKKKTKLGYIGNMSEISITVDGLWSNMDELSLLWMKQEKRRCFQGLEAC
jgi:hypothetical protein